MAGETAVQDAKIPGGDDREQDDAPKDVRGAIRAALDEVGEKDDNIRGRLHVQTKDDGDDDKSDRKSNESVTEEDPENESVTEKEPKKTAKRSVPSESQEKEPDQKVEAKEPDIKSDEPTISPPPYYKNKGKSVWDGLSADHKKLIVAREAEISNGFAQVSQRLRNVEEIEKAIAPRLQYIQAYGTTPGVVVDRLFQWMEGINNPRTRLSTFKELAQSFGVDVNQLASGVQSQQQENSQPQDQEPPPWFQDFSGAVEQEIGSIKQTFASQQERAMEHYILNWAKDKPHYETVRELMGQLLAGGAIPLKNGTVDLDGAYEAATKLHPEVSAQMQQEASQKAAQEATAKAAKDAKEKLEKVERARKAGSGIRPAAPSVASAGRISNQNLNGTGKKSPSVRDSLRQSLDELRS